MADFKAYLNREHENLFITPAKAENLCNQGLCHGLKTDFSLP